MADRDVESFLALLAARRSPRTVEAYQRDLNSLTEWLGRPPATASTEDLERYLAAGREAGLSPATLARRAAAIRMFFRHLQLMDRTVENAAAALDLPRRTRRLPRTLSPAEAERLIEAANGPGPRDLRDRALVELLYGAGLRVSEAVGLERGAVDLENRVVRAFGKGSKERIVPIGRQATEALRRYLARGRPHLDKRHRPEIFLNANGGPPPRARGVVILRRPPRETRLRPGGGPPPP